MNSGNSKDPQLRKYQFNVINPAHSSSDFTTPHLAPNMRLCSRVESTTISTDVAIGSGLDSDPTQLGHGINEGRVEGLSTMGPNLDSGLGP